MNAALLSIVLAAGVSQSTNGDTVPAVTATVESSALENHSGDMVEIPYEGHPIVMQGHFNRCGRFSPPDLYCPRQGYQSGWYRFFYRPTFNYRHQFDFPWHSPSYQMPRYLPHGGSRPFTGSMQGTAGVIEPAAVQGAVPVGTYGVPHLAPR